jgi:O-antigen/teichoic acid export membrane protein
VFFLGLAIAVQISFSVFNGILTGCHRWDLHNINTSGWYAVTVAGMIVALLAGKGLIAQAVITLACEIMAAIRRVILARRVCKGLQLRPALVERGTIVELFSFGGKTLLPSVSDLLLNQTTSVLLTAYIGPAALALYSRPRALAHCMKTLVNKMAMTLTPTTSALQSKDDIKGIGELAVKSARYALYFCLPMVLLLTIFGEPIMRIWMGPRYANGWLPAIFAVLNLPVLVQLPTLFILAGLNEHGRAGAARCVASMCSAVLAVIMLHLVHGGLIGTAVAVMLPLTILNIVDIPRLICRRAGLSVGMYFTDVCWGPALHTLPFAACLIASRILLHTRPLISLLTGAVVGGVVLGVLYWSYVVPDRVRYRVSRFWRTRTSMKAVEPR